MQNVSLTAERFLQHIRELHARFMHGEISQGYLAERLGIGRADLIHLLEAMGLQVTNL